MQKHDKNIVLFWKILQQLGNHISALKNIISRSVQVLPSHRHSPTWCLVFHCLSMIIHSLTYNLRCLRVWIEVLDTQFALFTLILNISFWLLCLTLILFISLYFIQLEKHQFNALCPRLVVIILLLRFSPFINETRCIAVMFFFIHMTFPLRQLFFSGPRSI